MNSKSYFGDPEESFSNSRLDFIKYKISKAVNKAKKIRANRLVSPSTEALKIAKAQENRSHLIMKENEKAQQIIENMNSTLEFSRVRLYIAKT
jgi:hypothetical protein